MNLEDTTPVDAWMRQALALHRAGRIDEAQALYRRVLQVQPRHFDALHLLGVAVLRAGDATGAAALFAQALALRDDVPAVHNNLGNALRAAGRLPEAIAAYDRALALDPGAAEVHHNRGLAHKGLQRLDEALASFDRALALQPRLADGHNHRGNVLLALGRAAEALAAFDAALAIAPRLAIAHHNRGQALAVLGRFDEALASHDRAVALDPGYANAHRQRAQALEALGRPLEALAAVDHALVLAPRDAESHDHRGRLLLAQQRADEALAAFDRAIALRPDLAVAHHHRGHALKALGRLDEAVAAYGRALALAPDLEFLPGELVHARLRLCDWTSLDAWRERLVAGLRARRRVMVPFAVLGLLDDPALQKTAAEVYAEARCPGMRRLAGQPGASEDGRLRIGYFSADFHDHATAHLAAQLFEAHDRRRFEVVAFSFGPDRCDEMRARLQRAFDRFVDVRERSDAAVAALARELGLDIAVDLKGYTQHARPGLFAAGCAPVQVNFLGYPGTLGSAAIDYVIADRIVIPPGCEAGFTEKVVRLPHSFQVNDTSRPIAERRFERRELGLPEAGVVFCCFNQGYKILPPTFDAWVRILQAVPGSVLWLLQDHPSASANLRREAEARGLPAGRLVFAPRLPMAEHLARLRAADLVLDTWPYNAHTTASDALWAGVPVLTVPGQAFASRVAASLLHAVGLPELVAGSVADYEQRAIELARRAGERAALKARLQGARATSPLFDGRRFADDLERAFERMAGRHRSGLPPEAFDLDA